MQRAAMRGVDADLVLRGPARAKEGTGLGAMTMQNIRLETADHVGQSRPGHEVEQGGFAPDDNAIDAELHARRDLGQRLVGALAAGQAVGDDPDVMALLGLAVGQIKDVPDNAADGSARRVQDAERLAFDDGHGQNQRSPTSTVSPGAVLPMQPDSAGADDEHTMAARAPRIRESRLNY